MRRIAGIIVTFMALLTGAGSAITGASAAAAPCSVAPVVHTSAASGVTGTDAGLHGTVNPEGCATTYQFEYGGTTAYGDSTTAASAGAGTATENVSAALTGLSPHTTYHVRLVATSSAGTTNGADVALTTSAACTPQAGTAPAVASGAADSVTATDATAHGTVNPNGCATTYVFQYGTTTAYGATTTAASAGAGTTAGAVSAKLTGLTPHATYHVRLVATSAVGTTNGPDVTFATAVSCAPGGSQPSVTTGAPAGVSFSSEKLTGSVTPNGCATTYHFDYGTTTAYGKSTASHSVGAGNAAVAASTTLTGLSSSTTYHVRLVGTNSAGTVDGADVAFTTPPDCAPGKAPGPGAATLPATNITLTGATLTGAVDPVGCGTTYRFDYGTTTAYGSSTVTTSAGSGDTAIPVTATLSGLAPNTVFHYRVVAASATGTTNGADGTFTTAKTVLPTVTLPKGRASLTKGREVHLTIGCRSTGGGCRGQVALFRNHIAIGSARYSVSAGATKVVTVTLNAHGRSALHGHARRSVETVARGDGHLARRFITVVR